VTRYAVEVEQLSVRFGDHLALEDVTLAMREGAFVAIVGPNGSGKTTFLKVLLGLQRPTAGRVRLFGEPPGRMRPHEVGYLPQIKTLDRRFPALALELVMTGLRPRWPWRLPRPERERAFQALEQVGVRHLADRPLGRLSGGELQRVYLARSLIRRPRLLVLDEPATGVDVVGEADLYQLLEAYQRESGATILMVTQHLDAAHEHADEVLLLNHRRISFGPPATALSEESLRRAFRHVGLARVVCPEPQPNA
jgi:zinc transport system ATP-binding protein